jgi:Sec-independent protein secretion pathway component TatC
MDIKARLSTFWIVVMINIAFADIFGFMIPGALEKMMAGSAASFPITQEIMLAFAIITEIPIAMIFLSQVLKNKVNRWANIIASVITIVFIVAGGTTNLSYIFFATIEIVCLFLIVWYAWRWRKQEA